MAVEVVDKLKPKNNGKFKIVDIQDIDYEGKDAKTKIEELIEAAKGDIGGGGGGSDTCVNIIATVIDDETGNIINDNLIINK